MSRVEENRTQSGETRDPERADDSSGAGVTVPRQRRDAYTLYAEIYALRLDVQPADER